MPHSILPHNIQNIYFPKQKILTVTIKKKPCIYVIVSYSAPRSYTDGFFLTFPGNESLSGVTGQVDTPLCNTCCQW